MSDSLGKSITPSVSRAFPTAHAHGRLLVAIALILGQFMQMLDATIMNVALPHMQGSMSADQDQITWVLTSYVVMAGICTPLTAFVSARYGRKSLFIASVVSFTIASMLCGAAQSLQQIVLFRMLQGAAGAFLAPLSQTILMDIYPKEKHAAVLAAWSGSLLLAPILGPTIGSYLTEFYSWRWTFYINLPIGVLSVVGALTWMAESRRDPKIRFDALGFLLLSTAIGALQMMLDRGTTLDWFSSWEIVVEASLAALALYLFITHMLTAPQPFLSPMMFKDANFIIGMATFVVMMFVMFGNVAIFPTLLQSLLGYPVMTTGLLMLPRGIGALFATAVFGRFARKLDPRAVILVGLIFAAASLWQMSKFTLDVGNEQILIAGFLQGIGSGLVFTPLINVIFSTLSSRYLAEGTSMVSLFRNVSVAIGVSVDATLLAQNTQTNHAELAPHISLFNRALQYLPPAIATDRPLGAAILDSEVTRQAGMIAYDNLFRLSALLIVAAALIVLFARLGRGGAPEEVISVEV